MGKPEGYPFMRIARQFGVDYGVVLKVAGDLKDTGRADWLDFPYGTDPAIMIEMAEATEVQRAIRDGEIDWQTGELVDRNLGLYGEAGPHEN